MNAITFDTYKAVKHLMAEGLPERQATAIVGTIQTSAESFQASHEADKGELVTEPMLKAELSELKAELIKWMFGGMFGGFVAVIVLLVTILLKLH